MGPASTTCRRCRPHSVTARDDPGRLPNVLSALSIKLREADDAPGCLPGLRPDLVREEHLHAGFFDHGASEDGGRAEFDESSPSRRSNSAILSVCRPTIPSNSALRRDSSTTCAFSRSTRSNSCSYVGASGTKKPWPTYTQDQPQCAATHLARSITSQVNSYAGMSGGPEAA
jgi:hypothetical protein